MIAFFDLETDVKKTSILYQCRMGIYGSGFFLSNLKEKLFKSLKDSPLLRLCQSILGTYERISLDSYHFSDWRDLIHESLLSDFSEDDHSPLVVSTMHGAKGKEFDTVVFVYPGVVPVKADEKRLFYVAMTRAKKNLIFFVSEDWGKGLGFSDVKEQRYKEDFDLPDQLSFSLGMKDVVLDCFIENAIAVSGIESGENLFFEDNMCVNRKGEALLAFSGNFRRKLDRYEAQGYSLTKGNVLYRVYWHKREEGSASGKEYVVLLPEVVLRRR